ncbi:ATP-binding cassette domain-containing protein [Paenibacillus sp. IB182496]|uniref:ATP-binding cassette domain-containing protein n=1 Tax=Paenibacillus sabuli TaxID=2772509 RepID=A0A927BW53_9BACL|nr:ATP-binding cassette domain-containing protein [Paenibacillus sabuli]MBD2847963.1 ATP-binding cassette domain-containing protein [Paenibacillus sabuli]
MIELQNLQLRRDARTILDGVTLRMNEGEHWVILGRNGSGKTTLLEMMTGYLFPSSGTVDVLGNRFGACDVREVRKQLGYISQSLMEKLTLGDPVWEVVATGAYAFLRFYQDIPQEVQDKSRAMLADMGIGHLADQPLGTLSQGERKKALLARALMADPRILIMDEPCAGLDLYEREKFLVELNRLTRHHLMAVYVTHHIEEIVPMFTHVALIHEGRVAAAGPKREVLTPQILSRAYELPIEVEWAHDRPWIRVALGDPSR